MPSENRMIALRDREVAAAGLLRHAVEGALLLLDPGDRRRLPTSPELVVRDRLLVQEGVREVEALGDYVARHVRLTSLVRRRRLSGRRPEAL
jgi:hypothetical protein